MKTTTYFEFQHRTIVKSGSGTHILVPDLIEGLGGKRPMLFADKGITNAGLTKKIENLFTMVPGTQLVGVYDEVQQDAKSAQIDKAIAFYKESNADSIIAIGGGSVLDTAKAVKWAISNKVNSMEQALTGNIIEVRPQAKHMGIPHVSIATTAGTGAEVSAISVVLNERMGVKVNLLNPFIGSDIAVLDPDLTIGLPANITAFTGMDALTHAVEGYFSSKSNAMSDAYALQAIKMIQNNLRTAVNEGSNLAARANMLQASAMAITSFQLAFSAVPVHNMAHAFGAKYGIPHGLANAILLPYVMKHLPGMYLGKVKGFAEALGIRDAADDPKDCLAQCISEIHALREAIQLPADFASYKIEPSEIPNLVMLVQTDPSGEAYRIPDDVIANVTGEVIGTGVKSL